MGRAGPAVSRSAGRIRQRQYRAQPSAAVAPACTRSLDEQPLNLSHTGPSPYAARLARSACRRRRAAARDVALLDERRRRRRGRDQSRPRGDEAHAHRLLRARAITASASARCRQLLDRACAAPFEPLLPGCTAVPFGDVDALARALARKRRGRLPRRAGPDRGRRALRAAGLPARGATSSAPDTARCSRSTKCRPDSAARDRFSRSSRKTPRRTC